MRTLKIAFLGSAVIFIILQLIYYPQLPENIAVHFNANGEVNGWMPKEESFISSFLIVAFLTAVFTGIPYFLKIIPPNLINVPKKDYWLSPQNKDRLVNILTANMYFIGLATNLFTINLFYQIYRFNIHAVYNVSMIVIVPYLFCVSGSIIYLFVRLNKCD